MSEKLPQFLENRLLTYVKKTFYPSTRRNRFIETPWEAGDTAFFAAGVEKLHKAFTSERGFLPKNYLNQKDLRAAYLLYFLPSNLLKITALLKGLDFSSTCKVLDLGSGPATGILGLLALLEGERGSRDIQATLVDQNRNILQDGESLTESYAKTFPNLKLRSKIISCDIQKFRFEGNYDLIISANIFNEFPKHYRPKIVQRALSSLSTEGRLLIIEPALRSTTRDLMELRDEVLRKKLGFVHAPCLHQNFCPMFRDNARDWCHTYIEWKRPKIIGELDRRIGNRKDYLKCSYLIMGKSPPPRHAHGTWRVVSGLLKSKGKSEILLCGPGSEKLYRARRLDKERSRENAFWDVLKRGDILKT